MRDFLLNVMIGCFVMGALITAGYIATTVYWALRDWLFEVRSIARTKRQIKQTKKKE